MVATCRHDPESDRYLLLARDVTQADVDSVWRALSMFAIEGDAYLAFAALDYEHGTMPIEQARALHRHTVERELSALRLYTSMSDGGEEAVAAAQRVVVHRAARRAAEQLLKDSARDATTGAAPVLVRYRIVEDSHWDGRIADTNVEAAREEIAHILEVASQNGLSARATSVAHGWSTVAASRSPEFAFAAHVDSLAMTFDGIAI
jgi:hypothetical protein